MLYGTGDLICKFKELVPTLISRGAVLAFDYGVFSRFWRAGTSLSRQTDVISLKNALVTFVPPVRVRIAQAKMLPVGDRRAILECYPSWRRVTQ